MAKKGRKKARVPASWLWRRYDGTLEEAHEPTKDELVDLHRELIGWREAQPDAMPLQLWERLIKYIQWPLRPFQPWTQERKDQVRWEYVRKGIDLRGRDDAFEYASNALKGTPAAGEPDTMEWSYKKVQRKLRLGAGQTAHRKRTRG
jgi:hypothetical protein